jgi:hypothetical protein
MKTNTILTQEELQAKAIELTTKYGCEVQPIEFIKDDEQIIGFIKTPSRMLKVRVLDMAVQGAIVAATTLLDSVLIKEESDARLSSEKSEDDDIYFGAALAAFSTIEILTNIFKKK